MLSTLLIKQNITHKNKEILGLFKHTFQKRYFFDQVGIKSLSTEDINKRIKEGCYIHNEYVTFDNKD